MSGGTSFRYDVLYNDQLPGAVNVTIGINPSHGTATVESDQTITYIPDASFNKDIDTVGYTVCLKDNPLICDDGLFVIYVNRPVQVAVQEMTPGLDVRVYPVPASEFIVVESENGMNIQSVTIFDQSGRIMNNYTQVSAGRTELDTGSLISGIYVLRINLDGKAIYRKIAVNN